MKRITIIAGFLFIVLSFANAQSDSILYYYNQGFLALQNNDCRNAENYFLKSSNILPHKDTFFNLALTQICLGDTNKYCYYLSMAKSMGDSSSHDLIQKKCSDFDISTYIKINFPTSHQHNPSEMEIFTISEIQPTFPGGDDALLHYLGRNLSYPIEAKEQGIQGTIFITFVVETDGSISNVKVLRGIGGGCDEEALRVVRNMPKWSPGMQRGKYVRVQFNLPIRFLLSDGEIYPKLLSEGEAALRLGDCYKAEEIFSNQISSKKKRHITSNDYYNLAMSKICLKDSLGYCYYLRLALDLYHIDALNNYNIDCINFNFESYAENFKTQKIIEQQQKSAQSCTEVFKIADIQPVFPGDITMMNDFIKSNIEYPKKALKNNISGKVYVSFIITHEGKIENIVVLKGLGYGCDEEAVRVIKSMPQWTPGILNGQNVCMQYNLAITFSK